MDYEQLQHLRRLQKEYELPFVPKDIWEEAVLYSGNHDDDDTLVFWIRNLMGLNEEERMNKKDKPVIIVSDTDYAKICNELEKAAPDEHLGILLDCIKVVVDAKTEKRLWKAKSGKEPVQKMHTQTWKSSKYGWIEVTGTDEQFITFVKKYNNNSDMIALALDCGLSIKKH